MKFSIKKLVVSLVSAHLFASHAHSQDVPGRDYHNNTGVGGTFVGITDIEDCSFDDTRLPTSKGKFIFAGWNLGNITATPITATNISPPLSSYTGWTPANVTNGKSQRARTTNFTSSTGQSFMQAQDLKWGGYFRWYEADPLPENLPNFRYAFVFDNAGTNGVLLPKPWSRDVYGATANPALVVEWKCALPIYDDYQPANGDPRPDGKKAIGHGQTGILFRTRAVRYNERYNIQTLLWDKLNSWSYLYKKANGDIVTQAVDPSSGASNNIYYLPTTIMIEWFDQRGFNERVAVVKTGESVIASHLCGQSTVGGKAYAATTYCSRYGASSVGKVAAFNALQNFAARITRNQFTVGVNDLNEKLYLDARSTDAANSSQLDLYLRSPLAEDAELTSVNVGMEARLDPIAAAQKPNPPGEGPIRMSYRGQDLIISTMY